MKTKKGFTLIELLAVIVILAIIMVIAVPQILNVINSTTEKAWKSNVKMIRHAINTNSRIIESGSSYKTSPRILCDNETNTNKDVTNNIKTIAKIDNTTIECKKNTDYIFTLTGTGRFEGREATIRCLDDGNCTETIANSPQEEVRTYFIRDGYKVSENTVYLTSWYSQTTRYEEGKGVYFKCNSSTNYTGFIFSDNLIDVSQYKKIVVKYKFTTYNGYVGLYVCTNKDFRNHGTESFVHTRVPVVGEEEVFEADISEATGNRYIVFDTPATKNEGYVTDFYLVNK